LTPGEEKMGKYINTPETEVYHKRELLYGLEIVKQEIKKTNQAIIAEGELDVISSWQAGVKNIVAIKGSALTEEQIRILKRYTEELVLALDTDIAGDQAARRGIQIAQAQGLEVKTVRLEGGKDPDEVAQKDASAWKKAVKGAKDIYEFYLDTALERWDARTAEGKRKIAADLLPLLAEIPNSIVQSHWIGEMGKKLEVKEEVLVKEMGRIGRQLVKSEKSTPAVEMVSNQREKLEQLMIGYWLEKEVTKLLEPKITELISCAWGKKLAGLVKEMTERQGKVGFVELRTLLPAELQEKVAEALMLPEFEDNQGLKISKVMNKLKELDLKEKLKQVREEVVRWEEAEDEEKLLVAQRKFSDLSRELAKIGGEKV